jgi:hypothetical protein
MQDIYLQYLRTKYYLGDNIGGIVGAVSLSGKEALVAVADVSEFRYTGKDISPLYAGVWGSQVHPDSSSSAVKVLKSLGFGHLFDKTLPSDPNGTKQFATYADLSELLRKSLRDCIVIMRGSKDRLAQLSIIHFRFLDLNIHHINFNINYTI